MYKFLHRKRALRAALLFLLMSAGVTKVFAQDEIWVDYIQYHVTSGTNVEVVGAIVDSDVLTIPPTITYQNQEYTVVGIGSYAFENRANYPHYVLPNTVTTIGTGAFKNSIIESIAFSDNLTNIGACAFEGCESLTMLNLTNCTNMTTIGTNAFYGMPNVWLIMLPESITTIGIGAFSSCTNLNNLYLPGSITTIGDSAFSNCPSLGSLTLPQSVTELGVSLFDDCTALKDLYVQRTTPPSASFQTFDGWFQDYAEHVYVPYGSGSTYQGATGWLNLYSSNLITETNILLYDYGESVATVTGHIGNVVGALEIPNYSLHYGSYHRVTAVASEAFANCTGITSVTFGEFMEDLGQSAFESCSGITSVDLSACLNMNEIGNVAFEGCTSMTSVTLPQTLLSVGGYAFYNTGLTSITLPTNVTHIGTGAFCSCAGLTTITSMTTVPPTVGIQAFMGCESITKIKVPYGSTTDYMAAPVWGSFDESVYEEMSPTFDFYYDDDNHIAIVMGYGGTIPSVLEIPATVTHNEVEYTVTAINGSAFKNQTGVSQFILPNTITIIGPNAFSGCRYADINIPESLTALGEGAFVDCDHITSVTLPEGLTSIPPLAFYSCSFLTELYLPSTLTSIGIRAFANCNDLVNVYTYATTPPTCAHGNGDDSFLGLDGTTNLYVPFGCYSVYAEDAEWNRFSINQGGFTYTLDEVNHTATITGVTEYTFGDLVVPATMNSYPTTTIAANAFSKEGITSISLPASVTTIEAKAFANCTDLTAITVASENANFSSIDGVLFNKAGTTLVAYPCGKGTSYSVPADVTTIADQAFYGSNLTSIALPASVTTFGSYSVAHNAFEGATQLTTITVASENANFSAVGGVLFDKAVTTLMVAPEGLSGTYNIPASVTTIDRFAFYNCDKLTLINLDDALTTIRDAAFNQCTNLTSMVIPEGVTTINVGAFNNCANLSVLTCYCTAFPTSAGNPFLMGVNPDLIIYVRGNLMSQYEASEYWNAFTLEAITDPDANIQYSYDDTNLTATVTGLYDETVTGPLNIPATVTHNSSVYTVIAIADSAFMNCTGLTSITTPHTLENIGASAFESCTSMESVVIGRNVKTIGSYAFKYCYELVNIDYYAVNCGSLNTTIWYDALELNKNLTIHNSVKSIPSYAFFHLVGLTSVTIPSSTESIGEYAFAANNHLISVTIGSNVKTIGAYAFWRSEITSIDLQNVEEVGKGLFEESTALQTVTLHNSLSRLEDRMFYGCTSLNNVSIPSGVRTIGKEAFVGCTGLTTLTTAGYASNLTTIDESAFEGSGLTSIDIPNSVTTIGFYAFYECTALKNIIIGTGLKELGFKAFYGCTAIESVEYRATHCDAVYNGVWSGVGSSAITLTITDNVEYLPSNTFSRLQGFTTVTLPNGLTNIGANAFSECSLTSIDIPNSVSIIGYEAFYNTPLETITLGSGVTRIQSRALNGSTNTLTEIISYNTTPPTIYEETFNSDAYTAATLKVLGPSSISSYGEADYWKNFINIESMEGYYFTGDTDSNWSTASNWLNGIVPTTEQTEPNVVILADATVDITNAYAYNLTIKGVSVVVTIPSGKKLQIGDGGNGSFTAPRVSSVVVEEGGQLWNAIDVQATVKKGITAHGSNDGWNFISSPIGQFYDLEADWLSPTDVEGLVAATPANYDLYRFDQTQLGTEWQNYKLHGFDLRNGWGYLYANAANTTLEFAGTVKANEYGAEVSLEYTDQYTEVPMDPENPEAGYYNESYPFAGWNLVGNPFACNAYFGTSSGFENLNFYKMNDDGDGIEAVENISGTSIPACSGIFVKTPNQGTSLMFVRELDPSMMSAPNNGGLQIALEEATTRGASERIDNAIVSFNEGSKLEKFVLFPDNAQICIPQEGKDFAIVSSESRGEVPVNFKATRNGSYSLTVAPSNVEMAYLHLIDNLTGADVDLLATPSYTFAAKTTDYASRFRLVFSNRTGAEGESFAFFSNGNLVILNDGQATVQLIDVTGRILSSERISGNYEIHLNATAGVYVLRLIDGNNVRSQKIVIQ